MKLLLVLFSIATVAASSSECGKKNKESNRYQGRLEIKGICSNYTIKLISGELPDSLIAASWTDDNTGKTHSNVFRLGNPCDFPTTINEGESFYFSIDTSAPRSCMVCEAYYPTPSKKAFIKVEAAK